MRCADAILSMPGNLNLLNFDVADVSDDMS